MRKGTRVGDAYVKVTADGDSINKDIIDDLDDGARDVDRKGNEHGEEYGDGFSEGFERKWRSNAPKVAGRMGRSSRVMGRQMGDDSGDEFANRMESMVDRLGQKMGKSLGKSIRKSLDKELGGLEQRINASLDVLKNELGSVSRVRTPSTTSGDGGGQASLKFFEDTGRFAEQFEAARVKLHKESNDAIERDDADLVKRQQGFLETLMKDEKARADFIGKFEREREKLHAKSNDAITKDDDNLRRDQQKLFDSLIKMAAENAHIAEKFAARRVEMQQKANDAIAKDDEARSKAYTKLIEKQQATFAAARRAAAKDDRKALERYEKDYYAAHRMNDRLEAASAKIRQKAWADTANAHAKYLDQVRRGKIDERGESLRPGGAKGDQGLDISGMIGKMFGAGSRNNFLNVMGSSIGGLAKGVETLGTGAYKAFKTFSDGASQAAEAASEAGRSLSMMQKMGAGFSATFTEAGGSLAAMGPAALIAIPVVILAASALASVLSGLVGIATMLVSTIASGLVGAALVAAPAMAALAAAGGLAALAFMSMTNAQQAALKNAFIPFKEEMTGIAQLMLQRMVPAFSTWSANLQRAMQPLGQYAAGIGQAFADAGNRITGSLNGPGIQAFIGVLGVRLPGIIRNLSSAFGSFLNGMGGVFAALMPLVSRFTSYLADAAGRFAAWANSAGGRNSIVDFANRAVASLKSLWGFIKEVGGLIGDIFFNNQVQRHGDSMFDGMTRAVKGMRDAFRKAAADGSLQRWLDSARRFGAALWKVVKALYSIFTALESSGVLDYIAAQMKAIGIVIRIAAAVIRPLINGFGALGGVLSGTLGPMDAVVAGLGGIVNAAVSAWNALQSIPGMPGSKVDTSVGQGNKSLGIGGLFSGIGSGIAHQATRIQHRVSRNSSSYSTGSLISLGHSALADTYQNDGGYMPNPGSGGGGGDGGAARRAAAREARQRAAERRRAIREANATAQKAIRDMRKAKTMQDFRDARTSGMEALNQTGRRGKRARRVYRNLTKVNEQRGGWLGTAGEGQTNPKTLRRVLANTNSLGTIAYARAMVTRKLEKANQKLHDAIAMRDEYKKSIADAAKAYGNLLTAEGKMINGVTQKVDSSDIITNLQTRLNKIKEFNSNMQILLAQGLNKAAYKQLMDGGVEGSSDAAAALVAGGLGAVSQVNSLVTQIGNAGDAMGSAASSRLYQAGVDAARGLVAGLESLDKQLDRAAERIGNRISSKIKQSLGIKSPSRVMMANMEHVGTGLVKGLDRQHKKVESATARLGARIAVSPEVAAYAASQGKPAVSGNQGDPRFRDLIVQTPTEDPQAVAHEVLNEVTGRL